MQKLGQDRVIRGKGVNIASCEEFMVYMAAVKREKLLIMHCQFTQYSLFIGKEQCVYMVRIGFGDTRGVLIMFINIYIIFVSRVK